MNETFFATIAGAFVALLGVLISLNEERKKAKEEREFLAKHKALVSAAESVTRFIGYYTTLADSELPKNGIIPNEVADMSVALNNLHFYSNIDTIKHSLAMSQILHKAYINALKAKMPSMFIAEDIKAIDIQILGFEKMNSQIQQEILALLSADSTSPLIVSHRKQLAINYEKMAEFYERKGTLVKTKYHATEACRDVIKKDLKEVHEALVNVLLMARKELAFPIDEAQYKTMLNQATESALASMDDLFKEVRAEVEKKLQ
jgi:hypothetical protein